MKFYFWNLNKKRYILNLQFVMKQYFKPFNKKIELLINITNDAWFGNFFGPKQHLTASIFRSVEKGIPLIRSANSGISVVTNENGKILKKIGLNKSGFIEHDLNLLKNETFFLKHKNIVLVYLILIILFICMLTDCLIKKKKKI